MSLNRIRRVSLAIGTAAVLALSTGVVPGLIDLAPRAQAAARAQHGGHSGHTGSGHGPVQNIQSPSHNSSHNDSHSDSHNGSQHNVVRQWNHVHESYRYFYGPRYQYDYEWYFYRHISFPWLYVSYDYEPVDVCFSEYYFYEGVFYCFVGD